MKRVATAALAVLLGGVGLASAEVPKQPTFTKDILPIFQENCQECHRPKPINMSGMVAPFALTDYESVRPWAKAIAKAVTSRYMPPWFATEEFHGVFRNERALTQDQIDTIVRWTETGAKRGNPEDAPAALEFTNKEWWLGEPDLIVQLPEPVWVGDDVTDWQPNINIELTEDMLPKDRWIRTIEAQAGSTAVHHIVVYSTDPGAGKDRSRAESFGGGNIGGLAPGAEPSLMQEGYGLKLSKGTVLRVNMHYHKEAGPGTGVTDTSRLGFFFYPEDAEVKQVHIEPIGSLDFEIPPHEDKWVVGMARTFHQPIKVLNYLPHMHVRGVQARYVAYYPDGKEEVVLDVPRYDYNWQLYYEYPEPKEFPAGTRFEVQMTFDNSPQNESNPDPGKATRFGIETTDEMALGWMYYTIEDEKAAVPGADTD